MIDTGLTGKEFDSWRQENGWTVPTHIDWSFVPEMAFPRVSNAAKDAIRVWPASTKLESTGSDGIALWLNC